MVIAEHLNCFFAAKGHGRGQLLMHYHQRRDRALVAHKNSKIRKLTDVDILLSWQALSVSASIATIGTLVTIACCRMMDILHCVDELFDPAGYSQEQLQIREFS